MFLLFLLYIVGGLLNIYMYYKTMSQPELNSTKNLDLIIMFLAIFVSSWGLIIYLMWKTLERGGE